MIAGVVRVFLGLAATAAMWSFWMLVLVVIPMVVALYVARLIPLVRSATRIRKGKSADERTNQCARQ